MNEYPTPEQCLLFLKKAGCSVEVINHCLAVRDVAVRIATKAHANLDLVEAGALLHDIGRSTTHGIRHGVDGAKIAKKLGLAIDLVLIIERHVGAGVPKEEAGPLGLPPKDYLPETLEEKIVCHADNLITGDKQQHIEQEITKAMEKGQMKHAERLRRLHQELSTICGVDLNNI